MATLGRSALMAALLFPVPHPRGILRIPSFPGRASEFPQGGFKAGPCALSLCLEKEMWPEFACFPLFFGMAVAWKSPQCRV